MKRSTLSGIVIAAMLAPVVFAANPQHAKEADLERRAKLRIGVQKICPVSGRELDIEKTSYTVTDPETKENLYVCCQQCSQGKPKASYMETISENLAKAQKHCLVMKDNEITEKSKTAIIEGQRIYICCPPCTKKMAAAPDKYLAILDDLYESSLKK